MMRTTINLPDEITDVVRAVADAKGISLGAAITELIQRGLVAQRLSPRDSGFPHFVVPAGAPPITLEQTLSAEDES